MDTRKTAKAQYRTDRFTANHMQLYHPPKDAVLKDHQVSRKQTLEDIARLYHLPVKDLVAFNFPGAVSAHGKVLPNVVNWFLFQNAYFECPRAPDGVNAMFQGGEVIRIPKPGVAVPRARVIGAEGPPKGQSILCWAGQVLCDGKAAVAAEPPAPTTNNKSPIVDTLWSGSVRNQKGNPFRYSVPRDPGGNPRRIIVTDESTNFKMELRLKDNIPGQFDQKIEDIVRQAVNGEGQGRPNNSMKYHAGKTWAGIKDKFGSDDYFNGPNIFMMWVDPIRILDGGDQYLDQQYEYYLESFRTPSGGGVRG